MMLYKMLWMPVRSESSERSEEFKEAGVEEEEGPGEEGGGEVTAGTG